MMDADDLAVNVRAALEAAGFQCGAILTVVDKTDFEIYAPDHTHAVLTLELKP